MLVFCLCPGQTLVCPAPRLPGLPSLEVLPPRTTHPHCYPLQFSKQLSWQNPERSELIQSAVPVAPRQSGGWLQLTLQSEGREKSVLGEEHHLVSELQTTQSCVWTAAARVQYLVRSSRGKGSDVTGQDLTPHLPTHSFSPSEVLKGYAFFGQNVKLRSADSMCSKNVLQRESLVLSERLTSLFEESPLVEFTTSASLGNALGQ